MRPRASAVAALAIAVLAVGAAGVAGAAENPKDEQKKLVPGDMATAKRAVVTLADVRATFTGQFASEAPTKDDETTCKVQPDLSDLTITGEANSRDFSSDSLFISSEADVYETVAQAKAAFRRGAPPRVVIPCFHEVSIAESDDKFKITRVSAAKVPSPTLGDASVRYRFVYKLTERATGNSIRTHWELYVVLKGRTGLGVVVTGLGSAPSPRAVRSLAKRVVDRA